MPSSLSLLIVTGSYVIELDIGCYFSHFIFLLGHSDPAKLKETAQDVQHLSPNELKRRQEEIKVNIIWYL